MPSASPRTPPVKRVAVVGAGLTGLSCAYTLAYADLPLQVDVYEGSDRVGGMVMTGSVGQFTYELGPGSMRLKYEDVGHLIMDRLGLKRRIAEKKGPGDVFIVKCGEALKLGAGFGGLVQTKVLSLKGKLRALSEVFRGRFQEDEAESVSVDGFFRKRFGAEVADWVVDPLIGGIYSGHADLLSMKHSLASVWQAERKRGSVILGMIFGAGKREKPVKFSRKELAESFNYDEGMTVLPRTLADQIGLSGNSNLLLNKNVNRMRYDAKNRKWRVNGVKGYDMVISTVPAYALRNVTSNVPRVQELFQYLSQVVHYAPVNILALRFRRNQIGRHLDGEGMLIPSRERAPLLGIRFNGETTPDDEHKEGDAYITVYLGGSRREDIASLNDEDTLFTARQELKRLLGVHGEPTFYKLQRWPRGIPQYLVGYDKVLEKIKQVEESQKGLVFAGTYRGGIGVPDAIHSGIQTAEEVLKRLQH